MSNFELREESGSLFKNPRKTEPKHPDYKGEAKIDGTEYWVSGWIKEGKNGGAKFMSLAFQRKEERRDGGSGQSRQSQQPAEDDNPF